MCCWCDHFHGESCRWFEPTRNINYLELGFSCACMQSEFEQDIYIYILGHLSGRWKHLIINGIWYGCHKGWEKTKNKKDSSLLTFKLSLKIKYIDFSLCGWTMTQKTGQGHYSFIYMYIIAVILLTLYNCKGLKLSKFKWRLPSWRVWKIWVKKSPGKHKVNITA